MQKITVSANEAGQRLDKLLGKYLSNAFSSLLHPYHNKDQPEILEYLKLSPGKAIFTCKKNNK